MYKAKGGLSDDPGEIVRSIFSEDGDAHYQGVDVDGQITSIREDLDLLKSEIKKTLIDLREVIMKEKTVSMDHTEPKETLPLRTGSAAERSYLHPSADHVSEAAVSKISYPGDGIENTRDGSTLKVMGSIFQWILEIRQAGLSPMTLAGFLNSYADSKAISDDARASIKFIVNMIQEMKDGDPESGRSVSLDVYGSYIARLAMVLNGTNRGGPDSLEIQPGGGCGRSEEDRGSSSDPSQETTITYEEVGGGQGDSYGIADDSFHHRCSHCYEWHDSGHK